jgi:hypothetical protein
MNTLEILKLSPKYSPILISPLSRLKAMHSYQSKSPVDNVNLLLWDEKLDIKGGSHNLQGIPFLI